MAAFELDDNRGALFPNQFKESGDKKPDLRGDIMIDGTLMEIAGWKNLDKNSNEYISLRISEKRDH